MATVTILYPGQMGGAFAVLLLEAGHRVVSPAGGRSGRTLETARQAGIEISDTMAAAVAESDMVLSLVPPSAVLKVAEETITICREGKVAPVFVDMNAKTPDEAERLDAAFRSASLPFCNACVIGRASHLREEGRVYTSGADTSPVEEVFTSVLPVIRLGEEVARATVLKMVFTGVNKTITAALFESVNTANAFGVTDALFDLVGRYLGGMLTDFGKLVPTYPRHIMRRAEEMEALARMLDARQLPNRIALAAGETFRGLGGSGSWAEDTSSASLMELLARIKFRIEP